MTDSAATDPRRDDEMDLHNEAGELIATDNFTLVCQSCGSTVTVTEGVEQPHECT